MTSQEKLAHDLRAPLARAKTLTKLLQEASSLDEAKRYSHMLADELAELDQRICSIVEKADDA